MQPMTDETMAASFGFAETVTGIIISPAATMRKISGGNVLRLAIPAFFLALLVSNTATVLTETEFVQLLGGPSPALVFLTAFSLFFLVSQSGLCYLLARLFGGRGKFVTLLSLLALANVPSVFTAPLALARLLPGLAGGFIHGVGSLALAVWVIALGVLAVRETFQLSTWRAVIIFSLPLFLFLLLVVIVVLALSAALT
jgi:hypothetical protein